jgi:hypothetical protein
MDASQVVPIVSIAAGVAGFSVSMITLSILLRKQKAEDKKKTIDESIGITSSAGSLVSSAKELASMQEQVFDASIEQYKIQIIQNQEDLKKSSSLIFKLENDVLVLKTSVNELGRVVEVQKTDINLLKTTTIEQQKVIDDLNTKLFALKERDESNTALIKKLVRGIKLLIAQITEEKLVPRWTLIDAGLDDLKVR